MSYGIQTPTVTLAEISLFADIEENFQESTEPTWTQSKGELKTCLKHYTFSSKENTFRFSSKVSPLFKAILNKNDFFAKSSLKGNLLSLASESYTRLSKNASLRPQKWQTQNNSEKKSSPLSLKNDAFQLKASKDPVLTTSSHLKMPMVKEKIHALPMAAKKSLERDKKTDHSHESSFCSVSRHWKKEETQKWWDARYQQKERQGGNQDNQDQQQQEGKEGFSIEKSASISAKSKSGLDPYTNHLSIKKPELIAPKIGVFALYYILTKMGILSDGTSNFASKKEIELIDAETSETHKKRLEDLKQAIKKEKETARWSVAAKVFSWIASLISIISGIALIATGVGAVGGAMLIAGGAIQIASQVMELTGGWQKVAAILPGDDNPEKRRAVISWMQIGIGVLCLVLSGAGVFTGGFGNFSKTMQTAMGLIGGIAAMGHGTIAIGEGISNFFYKNKQSDIQKFDIRLTQLKHKRSNLMENMESGLDRLEKLFEDLARALEFEEELFQADLMLQRR